MSRKAKKIVDEDEDNLTIAVDDADDKKITEKAADKVDEPVIDTQDDAGEAPDEAEALIGTLKKQLEDANKAREDEKRAREEAEQRRLTAETQRKEADTSATTALKQQMEAQEGQIENGLIAAQSAVDAAEQEYIRAETDGDVAAKIAAQKKLARAVTTVDRWEEEKEKFNSWKKEELPRLEARIKAQTAAPQYTPQAQEWINRNPRFNTDDEFRSMTAHFHTMALRKGMKQDSPDYFKFIDDGNARYFADPAAKPKEKPEEEGVSQSSIAAVPSRDNAVGGSKPAERIRFTPGEMQIIRQRADAEGITVEVAARNYVKRKEQLKKEGRI